MQPRSPLGILKRTAQVFLSEGMAGLSDRMRQKLSLLPSAPAAQAMLVAARRQMGDRQTALFQPWHVAQYTQRSILPARVSGWRAPIGLEEFASVDPITLRSIKDNHRVWPGRGQSASTEPRVSIVTRTTGTRPALLRQAIASVLNQTALGVEHVIVQDGGDGMGQLCAEVRQEYGAPCGFLAIPRSGRSAAANAGVEAAAAPLVMFLDDDDLLFPHHVATLSDALSAVGDAPAAYSLAWEVPTDIAADGTVTELAYIRHPHQSLPFSQRRLRQMNFLPIQSVLFRREAFNACGGMNARVDLLEDWDLWLRMAALGDFLKVPQVTSLYRTPGDETLAAARQTALLDTQRDMTAGRS